jgi:rhamnosyltransferase
MSDIAPRDIAAVVVLYRPDEDVVGNVAAYADQVDVVLAIDNSEVADPDVVGALRGIENLEYRWMGRNTGIATALNTGCRRAIELGYSWVLTMDQDSTAAPVFVDALAQVLNGSDSDSIAIVVPMWQQAGGLPVDVGSGLAELDYAMTSGNLLRLRTFDALGGFRDDFFIDQVDHEFCLRARRAGWRIVQKQDVLLLHRMGSLQEVHFPIRCYITDYSPLRRYYMVRNLLEMTREFGDEFPGFVARQRKWWRRDLSKIVLAEPHRVRKLTMMYRGWRDYRRGRFGPYEELHSS